MLRPHIMDTVTRIIVRLATRCRGHASVALTGWARQHLLPINAPGLQPRRGPATHAGEPGHLGCALDSPWRD